MARLPERIAESVATAQGRLREARVGVGTPVRSNPFPAWPIYEEDDIQLIGEIRRSGKTHFWHRSVSSDFEARFAEWNGSKHAISCNSGTSALEVAPPATAADMADAVEALCKVADAYRL